MSGSQKIITTTIYDKLGRILESKDGLSKTYLTTYNTVWEKDPDGVEQKLLVTTNISPEGKKTTTCTNTRGLAVREEEDGILTENIYDGNGQITAVVTGDTGKTTAKTTVSVYSMMRTEISLPRI